MISRQDDEQLFRNALLAHLTADELRGWRGDDRASTTSARARAHVRVCRICRYKVDLTLEGFAGTPVPAAATRIGGASRAQFVPLAAAGSRDKELKVRYVGQGDAAVAECRFQEEESTDGRWVTRVSAVLLDSAVTVREIRWRLHFQPDHEDAFLSSHLSKSEVAELRTQGPEALDARIPHRTGKFSMDGHFELTIEGRLPGWPVACTIEVTGEDDELPIA